jgi:hypothetical protein
MQHVAQFLKSLPIPYRVEILFQDIAHSGLYLELPPVSLISGTTRNDRAIGEAHGQEISDKTNSLIANQSLKNFFSKEINLFAYIYLDEEPTFSVLR